IGDDVWLLVCASKAEVNRVLSLKRWKFGEVSIFLDRWITEAGRSAVMLENNSVWVVARGIPLHLRSNALFMQIGNSCGGFLRAESGTSLSSIRLKVHLSSSIPEEILIRHGTELFPNRIKPEGLRPLSPSGTEVGFFKKWKAKGKTETPATYSTSAMAGGVSSKSTLGVSVSSLRGVRESASGCATGR
ncbi:hypothetical protein LINPERHAP1_LOCUS21331, partial [Linum perenne]